MTTKWYTVSTRTALVSQTNTTVAKKWRCRRRDYRRLWRIFSREKSSTLLQSSTISQFSTGKSISIRIRTGQCKLQDIKSRVSSRIFSIITLHRCERFTWRRNYRHCRFNDCLTRRVSNYIWLIEGIACDTYPVKLWISHVKYNSIDWSGGTVMVWNSFNWEPSFTIYTFCVGTPVHVLNSYWRIEFARTEKCSCTQRSRERSRV